MGSTLAKCLDEVTGKFFDYGIETLFPVFGPCTY